MFNHLIHFINCFDVILELVYASFCPMLVFYFAAEVLQCKKCLRMAQKSTVNPIAFGAKYDIQNSVLND